MLGGLSSYQRQSVRINVTPSKQLYKVGSSRHDTRETDNEHLGKLVMKYLILCLTIFLCACTTSPTQHAQQPALMFQDDLFGGVVKTVNVDEIFTLTPAMRRYLDVDLAMQRRIEGDEFALYKALYDKRQIKIDYDGRKTKTAGETFRDRSGNCLSLAIMTAAFAKAMGFPATFQHVNVRESWSNVGELYFASRHVNIVIGRRNLDIPRFQDQTSLLVIDFFPPTTPVLRIASVLSEKEVVAMYLNNRAAEKLAENKIEEAYWLARQALQNAPEYAVAYNTLGIAYWRSGHYEAARVALEFALATDPEDLNTMSNLAQIYALTGQTQKSEQLAAYVKENRPKPYLYYFRLGKKEMALGNYAKAKELFSQELTREPEHHEVHFWLALAHFHLHELQGSKQHLAQAQEFSYTEKERQLYSSKLNALREFAAN